MPDGDKTVYNLSSAISIDIVENALIPRY